MICGKPFCHVCGSFLWAPVDKPSYLRGITIEELLEPREYARIVSEQAGRT